MFNENPFKPKLMWWVWYKQ